MKDPFQSQGRRRSAKSKKRPVARGSNSRRSISRRCRFESMEPRTLLTATPTGLTTFSSAVENGVIFSRNSFMAVLEASHGTSSYGFPQWHFLEFGDSVVSGASGVFNSNSTGASDVNSVSFQFYNTATSGNFHPYAGGFSVYAIPDDTISGLANSGPFRNQAGQVGAAARSAPRAAASRRLELPVRPATG